MGRRKFPYKVVSCSESRLIHEAKKAWLKTQGIDFGDYGLESLPDGKYDEFKYWRSLNFYWCFNTEEAATAFRLRWRIV
jgi:hypothetical protein